MRGITLLLCTVFSIGVTNHALAADPEPLPTQADLHKLFDDGQYQPLIQKLARVLQLKGNPAKAYDRADLYLLRGEAFLQLRQQPRAVESFQLGLKELAAPDDPKDPRDPKTVEDDRRALRAVSLLVARSLNYQYTPKTKPVGAPAPLQPISILDLKQRKAAYAALLADVKTEMAPKVKAATAGKTLLPIVDLVKNVGDLRAVEHAATGDTKDSDALLKDVEGHAGDLMANETERDEKRTDRIASLANERIPLQDLLVGGVVAGRAQPTELQSRFRLKGLEVQDTKDLKEIIDTCGKIAAVAHDFADVGAASAATFQKIEKDASKTAQKAHDTLYADYNGIYLDDGKKK